MGQGGFLLLKFRSSDDTLMICCTLRFSVSFVKHTKWIMYAYIYIHRLCSCTWFLLRHTRWTTDWHQSQFLAWTLDSVSSLHELIPSIPQGQFGLNFTCLILFIHFWHAGYFVLSDWFKRPLVLVLLLQPWLTLWTPRLGDTGFCFGSGYNSTA